MTTTTMTPSFALSPSLATAWQDVDSSFERFCLRACDLRGRNLSVNHRTVAQSG
jgi:hypothetical protein